MVRDTDDPLPLTQSHLCPDIGNTGDLSFMEFDELGSLPLDLRNFHHFTSTCLMW